MVWHNCNTAWRLISTIFPQVKLFGLYFNTKLCNAIGYYDRIQELLRINPEKTNKMTVTNQKLKPKSHAKQATILVTLVVLFGLSYSIKVAYGAFLTRSKVAEAFLLVHPIQNTLNEFAVKNAGYPLSMELENNSFGLPQPFEIQGTYISSVVAHKELDTSQVIIFAYINTQIIPDLEDGKDILLTNPYIKFLGTFDGKSTQWECSSNLAKRYLPNNCSGS